VEPHRGDATEDVLRLVNFDTNELLGSYSRQLDRLGVGKPERATLLQHLERGLRGYTYLAHAT
jgi:arginine decarboxylase-like protein